MKFSPFPTLHPLQNDVHNLCYPAAWYHRGEGGGDGRRTHPAPAGGGHTNSAGGGRDAHRLRQQRATAHHAARPGAPLPAETLTRSLLMRLYSIFSFIGLMMVERGGHLKLI